MQTIVGHGAKTALIDGNGVVIAYSDPAVVAGPKQVLATDFPLFAPLASIEGALPGKVEMASVERPDGSRWHLAGLALGAGWRLGIAMPMEMVLGPHADDSLRTILVLLAILTLIGSLGLVVIRWLGGRWGETERALRESEGRYRSLFETSPDAVLVHSGGRVRFANPAAVDLLRAPSVEALVGMAVMDLVHPDFQAVVAARIRDTQAGAGTIPPLEQKLLALDGSVVVVEAKAQKTMVEGAAGSLTVIRDISDRKRAEAERIRSERLYRSVVNGTSEGYWAIDAETHRTVAVNDSLCAMLGYGRDEMQGRSPLDFVDEENDRIFREQMARISETDHRSYEITLKRKDGRKVVTRFNATTLRDDAGSVVSNYAFVTDITAQRMQEEENRRLHGRLKMILAATGEGVVGMDTLGHVTFVNQATERQTGWTEEELMGQPVREILDHSRADGTPYPEGECPILQALGLGEPVHAEGEIFRHKDGNAFPVEYVASTIRDGERTIGGVLAFHDISKRLEAESELAEMTAELQRSNADLQQFAYVASHDLQEPLRMVTSYLQLLERRYTENLGTEATEFIGFAVDGAKRMSALIRDLLEFSRVETRGGDLKPVDSGQAIAEAVSNLTVAIEEASARIETPDAAPLVVGDPSQLARLFQNVIGNAIKYRSLERTPVVRVGVAPGDAMGEWVFSVADNGIGIPEDQFDRVFMIFQRLHGRGKYEGTGIGLSVCKRIVERHGGRIWIESEPDQGSTFFFTLREASG